MSNKMFLNIMYVIMTILFGLTLVIVHKDIAQHKIDTMKIVDICNKSGIDCVVKTNKIFWIENYKIVK